MTHEELNSKVAEIRRIEKQAAILKQQIDELKDSIKQDLDNKHVDSINTGLYNIIYKCYEKKTVDSDKLKEAGLYDSFLKSSTCLSLRINDVKPI